MLINFISDSIQTRQVAVFSQPAARHIVLVRANFLRRRPDNKAQAHFFPSENFLNGYLMRFNQSNALSSLVSKIRAYPIDHNRFPDHMQCSTI
jgi:hypothetical protein